MEAIAIQTPGNWRKLVFGVNPNRTLVRVLVWYIGAIIFFHHFLLPVKIVGWSMSPTYTNGSMNLVNKLSYTHGSPHRGDVIALSTEGELLLKRIVAMPGETVSISGGVVVINGNPIADKFAQWKVPAELSPTHLGRDEFFVIGDNRSNTVFGKISKNQILGKILF